MFQYATWQKHWVVTRQKCTGIDKNTGLRLNKNVLAWYLQLDKNILECYSTKTLGCNSTKMYWHGTWQKHIGMVLNKKCSGIMLATQQKYSSMVLDKNALACYLAKTLQDGTWQKHSRMLLNKNTPGWFMTKHSIMLLDKYTLTCYLTRTLQCSTRQKKTGMVLDKNIPAWYLTRDICPEQKLTYK